jgi:hypothetical protein
MDRTPPRTRPQQQSPPPLIRRSVRSRVAQPQLQIVIPQRPNHQPVARRLFRDETAQSQTN